MTVNTVIVLAVIFVGIILLFLAVSWIKKIIKNKTTIQVDLAQGVFASLWMQDTEIIDFVGKDRDNSIVFGQERLWEETKKFSSAANLLMEEGSIKVGDYSLISSAIKICKIAYIMQSVEEHGAISDMLEIALNETDNGQVKADPKSN